MTDASAIVTAALASLAPYVGGGGLLIALGHAAVGIAKRVSPVLADSRLKRSEAAKLDADARKSLAEAAHMEAQTEAAEVQRDLARDVVVATTLQRYEDRLTAAEERAEKAEKRADDAAKTANDLRTLVDKQERTIQALGRAVRRLGGTPTGIDAVKE